jgi:ribosomal protein S18 acetylase RimI-like enzyme
MITVRPFTEEDADALAGLMMEMVAFYGASVAADRPVRAEIIRQSKSVDIIVADQAGQLLGFATFASLYPVAGLIDLTYIQQIYVAAAGRRLGVAQRLMASIAATAQSRGCTRLEWSTGRDNTAARALYDGLGAAATEKAHYLLEGDALGRLAAQRP